MPNRPGGPSRHHALTVGPGFKPHVLSPFLPTQWARRPENRVHAGHRVRQGEPAAFDGVDEIRRIHPDLLVHHALERVARLLRYSPEAPAPPPADEIIARARWVVLGDPGLHDFIAAPPQGRPAGQRTPAQGPCAPSQGLPQGLRQG
jgi:hypothetical protein